MTRIPSQARPAALAAATLVALSLAGPALAQSNADILKELQALKDKVAELENKLKATEAKAAPAVGQWGMTPEQARELNRVVVKTEALEDAVESQGLKMLKISGFMDPTYLYNQRQNRAGFQFLNPVAMDGYNYDNSYFGGAYLDLQKELDGGTKFRLTLVPNRGTGSVIGEQSLVQEASVSVPLGDLQTRFIAGQMPDWSGYEYQQATLNKLITHNLLYDFTLPTLYTGAGMEFVRGKWWSRFALANVNASKRNAGEKAPAFVYRVDYSRGEFQGFGFAGLHGKVVNYNDCPDSCADSRADLFEADAYFVRGDITWQGQLSFGKQKKAAIAPDPISGELRDASWWGLSTLVAYKFVPRWEAMARFDYLNNKKNGGGLLTYTGYYDSDIGLGGDYRNGIGMDPTQDCLSDNTTSACNKGANRMALSLGLSYLFNLNTTFKTELRLDRANLPVFFDVKTGEFRKNNAVFGSSVVVSF
ncbi:DUF3138 family protein [Aquabacterium sp. OR-4]|uniref:DUF3138 family protein n=1 Tax=Aquabacterium sp. OR-4 TaxID=2978127 RepID=UPI0028C9D11B|nr:DUF3138 family protein [Aquabacterium sp. OR-4]MDT7834689.1 DUF3138 family protein [Aquabacterium sp. OR-4]